MIKKILLILVAALVLFGTVQTSQAVLSAVDPGPYTAATGFFPLYYTDTAATTLDLCLSKAQSSRVPGAPGAPTYMCTLLPNPGIFDDTLPMVFPLNWPDEAFWFTGDAAINAAGVNLIYVSAVEAAFAGGVPAANDQVSFARIRIRADVPVAGTYTITHPYGVETFVVTTPGVRAINMTRDIGIGAPGVFTGALAGDVGPFLQSVNGPYIETNPDTLAPETFVGDPNLNELVTGSPFGTNFVRVQGPGIDVQTDLFAVSGRIWNNQHPTAVSVDRSTYTRTAAGSQVDVFATSTGTAALTFRNDLTATVETPLTGDGTGSFYGQSLNPAVLPQFVIVTATDATTTPTSLASQVVDVVKITRAAYNSTTKAFVIEATSSDETIPPVLMALGFENFTRLAPTALQRLIALNVPEPPARITVKSTYGGSDTEAVTVVPSIAPIAVDDAANTNEGVPVVINLVANDINLGGLDPASIVVNNEVGVPVVNVVSGTVAVNTPSAGLVTFTPALGFTGTATFNYTVANAAPFSAFVSNAATVTVTVSAAPVANDDTATTASNTPVTINVLANDTDPNNKLPLAVASVTQPAAGTGTVVNNGTSVTYTPAPNFTGTATFTYVASNSVGALSNTATVTVTVTANPMANPDAAFTTVNTAVIIPVLANDTDPLGRPLTVFSVTQPAVGTGTVVNNGTSVTYTPAANFSGAATFTYTAQAGGAGGPLSNAATVTVSVETITVKTAQYRTTGSQWNLNGSSTRRVGNTMTIVLTRTGEVIGVVPVGANGSWQLKTIASPVIAAAGDTITVTSAFGNTVVAPIQVRR